MIAFWLNNGNSSSSNYGVLLGAPLGSYRRSKMILLGLEDQLLAEVVKADRPDLEEQKAELTRQQNEYKILLKSLEDDLLMRLSSAGDNILSDSALVENLEHTKKTAAEIEIKVAEAKKTSFEIDKAREFYRPAAAR